MPKSQYILTNLTGGEVSPRMDMRVDVAKYKNGAAIVENAIVRPHGGAVKRPGTMHIQEIKTSSDEGVVLVPFEFNTEQTYLLEFGPLYIRFYRDQGIITNAAVNITGITQANPGVVTANSHGFANGDHVIVSGVGGMTQVNNRRFTVAGATANTFQLSGINTTGYTAYTSGGTAAEPVEVTTTYAAGEVDDLGFAQSADTLYIAHQGHPLAKLTRTSHTAWTLADADIEAGPFRGINGDDDHVISITVAAASKNISAITQANPGVVTVTATHDFLADETVLITGVVGMTEVNNNRYIVKSPTATTFQLYATQSTGGTSDGSGGTAVLPVNTTGFTAYASGGTVVRTSTAAGTIAPGTSVTLSSPASKPTWTSANVGCFYRLWEPGQQAGVPTAPVGDSTRTIANNDTYTHDGKVYRVANLTTWTTWQYILRVPSHDKGTVRVSTVGSHAGSFDAEFLHDTSCVVQITAFSSTTSVTAEPVKNHIPRSVVSFGTSAWEEGAWSDRRGYPSVLTFHESRLWAAGTSGDPQTVWASRTGAYEDFQDGADDNDALVYVLASGKVDTIRWLDAGKTLVLGTASGEYAVSASNQNEALTPSNVRIARQTPFGSGTTKPVRIANAVLFGQRNGDPDNASRKIRELTYSFDVDSYVAPDLTIIGEHVTGTGVTNMAYQAVPDSLLWAVRQDGQLAALTYEREQQVVGWHRHVIGGAFSTGAAIVERVAVIPGAEGDELWLIVKRTVNGSTRRYIEMLTTGLMDNDVAQDAIYLDSALTYSGSSTTSITGLWHLEGQSVYALVNGAKQGPFTVASGAITLTTAGTLAHVGLQYETIIETLDLEAAAAAGASKSRQKRISDVFLNVRRSLGGTCGPTSAKQDAILYRDPSDVMGQAPSLRTGFRRVELPSGWEQEAVIRIEHDEPYHFELLGLVAEINVSG